MNGGPLLIYGDSDHSADLFHALPLFIIDPFLYAEVDGRRVAVLSVLERDRVLDLELEIEVLDLSDFGVDELLAQGGDPEDALLEAAARAARELGIEQASVPPDFPLALAERLRALGTEVRPDRERFVARRRSKSPAQLAGIRRAQHAAEAAMSRAAQLLRDGGETTCEEIRAAVHEICDAHGADLIEDTIVAHGAQSALGHEPGSGPISDGEPVVIDITPRDRHSRCWADMTRTFCLGEPPDELAEYHALCEEALRRVMPEIRAGASCRELWRLSCEPFEAAGHPTVLSKPPGSALEDGYYHSLGHGIGLEVHERPYLGRSPDELTPGDVIAVEPGCYRRGFGGARLEDLVLVTEDGADVLTDFPYGLAP